MQSQNSMTSREYEVLVLILRGVPTHFILNLLSIKLKTLDAHISKLYLLFDTNTRIGLYRKATDWAENRDPSLANVGKKYRDDVEAVLATLVR